MTDTWKKLLMALAVSLLAFGVSAAQRSSGTVGNAASVSTSGNWATTVPGGGSGTGIVSGIRPTAVSPVR